MEDFSAAYKGLNSAQKKAVDTLEGPVMVVAGPGTGKTQVLALRIANILEKTDTPAHGILSLTFTRSGVKAMRERLARYIGTRAREVVVSTFHSFAMDLIEKHYALLDFEDMPALLDDQHAVALIDELLEKNTWTYLRPRGDVARYFADLRSLVSLMKRERLSPQQFLLEIEKDITALKNNPESLSSRGETKGQLKKEIQKRIEGLERTREVIGFYTAYEALKKARGLVDYDDVLEYAVQLVEVSEDVRADIREQYLYVLIDEHQDSSGVQNAFLKAVWEGTEQPNIFVVGDDRQLIYGFGGASLSYFEEFKTVFGKAQLITLTENYRSTAPILSLADELLSSALTKEPLKSIVGEGAPVELLEYAYARDEIIAAGLHFKDAIAGGISPEECALLLPKNRHIRSAVKVLRDLGLPIRSQGNVSLFSIRDVDSFRMTLRVVADPYDSFALSRIILDPLSGIPPLAAHAFLKQTDIKVLSVEALVGVGVDGSLFEVNNPVNVFGNKLTQWITQSQSMGAEAVVHRVGNEFLINSAHDHETLLRRIEVVRTMLHLVSAYGAQHPKGTLSDFLHYLDRLETYGQIIPVATLLGGQGISVVTLHGSKGLEFKDVWIAHMNESVLMAQKRLGFTLPEALQRLIEARDRAVATREVYVALTRAKEHCTISYARSDEKESNLELAHIVADLSPIHFSKKTAEETEAILVQADPKVYVAQEEIAEKKSIESLVESVAREYPERKVSVTLLNNFFECPWKWYFRNLLQLPEIKTEHQLFGSAVHGAVEKILKGQLSAKEKEVSDVIIRYLEKEGIVESAALKRLSKEGTTAVLGWAEHYLSNIAKDHSAERSLSYKDPKFPHLTMYGKIDLTERFPDGSIAVTDFKTGSSKTSGVIEKLDDEGRLSTHLRQLAMYSYLLRSAEKSAKRITSKLLYIEEGPKEKNALYTVEINDEQIDLLKRDIADYDELVKSGKWAEQRCNAITYDGNECEYCALRRLFNRGNEGRSH